MRDDEETCSEMHQRVDDLRETLWNICDERKDQAEQERSLIMLDGWLDDRLGILSNHYISLMQVNSYIRLIRPSPMTEWSRVSLCWTAGWTTGWASSATTIYHSCR